MSEANALVGEFGGWTTQARDEKLRGLLRVIRHFEPLSFEFSVSREQHDRLLRPVSPRGLANAHFTCCFGIISSVLRFVAESKQEVPVEFIFDEQRGVSDDIELFIDYMMRNVLRDARRLIKGRPSFKNDRQFLPLQAADMLAWHLRREHEMFGRTGGLPMADNLRSADGHLMAAVDETMIKSWASQFSVMPGVSALQGPKQWQRIKRQIVRLNSQGWLPPHGTRWKNAYHRVSERLTRLFRR
jgi:hypothetical protein